MKLGLRGRIVAATATAVLVVLAAIAATVWFVVPAHTRTEVLWQVVRIGLPIVVAVLAALAWVMQRWVVRPLTRTVHVMDQVRRGTQDMSARLPTRGGGEVAIINDGFNGLAQALAQRDRELAAALRAGEEGGRAKAQFLAAMSHELRTPLNAVLGLTELLQGTRLDARQQRFVALTRQSAHSLAGVIDDVLDSKRIEAGALRLVEAPFRLRDAVVGTVEHYRDNAERRGLSLAVHLDSALPDVVRGDMLLVAQVLGNLISNAIKFTEQGGVIVRATPCDLGVRFSVTDTGMGISSEVMPHIYEAFHQGDGTSTRRFGGTGLGLSISRHLCAAMGGRIDVSSRTGKGSTFWFDLPLPAVPGGPAGAEAMPVRPGHTAPELPGALGM